MRARLAYKSLAEIFHRFRVAMKLQVLIFIFVGLLVHSCSGVSKIINGELAKEGEFPHHVQLSIRKRDATKYCGGSLLADSQWVLTVSCST